MVSAEMSREIPFVDEGDAEGDARGAHTGRLTTGDVFVGLSMALVAVALGLGLIVTFRIDPIAASALAGAGFMALLFGHVALRRADARTDARTAINTEIADQPGEFDRHDALEDDAGKGDADDARIFAQPDLLPMKPPVSGLGAVRPRQHPGLAGRTPGSAQRTGAPASSDDVEVMIRRLADDIEAGRRERAKRAPAPAAPQTASDTGPLSLDVAEPETKPKSDTGAVDRPPAMVGGAAMAAPARQPGGAANMPPPSPAVPLPPSVIAAAPPVGVSSKSPPTKSPPTMIQAARTLSPQSAAATRQTTATAKLAAIADALTDEQIDVYLETINGLEDNRAQHYEVSIRLRAGDDVLDNSAFIARSRGTGLLPLIEAVKVSNTRRLAVQMIRRGRAGDFFSVIDGEALSDARFSTDVDTITGGNPDLAARLVLAFSQADVRALTSAQTATLADIAALGFKFSIEDITDLDMDFQALARRGFAFAKLDADVFQNGLPTGTTRVPPFDICRHLAAAGLTLIVGRIEDEAARARILGFGAILGQGRLFGGPRPVRADVLRPAVSGQALAEQGGPSRPAPARAAI